MTVLQWRDATHKDRGETARFQCTTPERRSRYPWESELQGEIRKKNLRPTNHAVIRLGFDDSGLAVFTRTCRDAVDLYFVECVAVAVRRRGEGGAFRWFGLLRPTRRLPTHQLRSEPIAMTESDQAHLDADVASLGQITASIETELANLKQTEAASGLDFTGLDAALAALRSAAPSAPSPEPAPAPVAQAEPEQPTEPAADVPPVQ